MLEFKPMQPGTQTSLQTGTIVQKDKIISLIEDDRAFIQKKHDGASTVGILQGDYIGMEHDLLLKRFNYRNVIDLLKQLIFRSRARRLWCTNLEFHSKGLPVPKPVAYIDLSFRNKDSFYLSTVIDNAEDLGTTYKKGLVEGDQELTHQLAETLASWHRAGAVHGDLKWSNILLRRLDGECRFFFIDLDHARLFPSPFIKGILKDLRRFFRFGLELSAEEWVESEFLPQYMNCISPEMRSRIDTLSLKNSALKDWTKRGRKAL